MKMNIDLKMKTERRNLIIRRALNFVFAVISFVIISTMNNGVPTALLPIPLAVCAAVFECNSPIYCAFFGGVCGLLLDLSSDTLISFNGIILTVCCMMTSLVFLFYLQRHLLNFLLADFLAVLLQESLHYIFFFLLWGYDTDFLILKEVFVPEFVATNIGGIIVYLFYKGVERIFGTVREHYIEDN